ncbi:uncharacterized protein N0V89_002408 [Didymosphaeria variabile]|uniref:DUF1749-domain-containing protein n=1 Tax=Didymosphaeria variabile TaxID=1932322 RepID=A0A9W9CEC0_9PLEO|nr:uncharacterized protein N0V89_002408 [Didymosphaeria variabile]KAJ4357832.1 hypothetical protein N0V89_002408 [Didymosphaeria variabile]
MASTDPFPVVVHRIASGTPNIVAYERAVWTQRNALVFIGGFTEGPHTNLVVDAIVRKLNGSAFSVWDLRMRSSYTGFGYSSLSNDVQDISALVSYLRTLGKQKIVLCGASTGCQDCLEYADREKHKSAPVDGYILLSPVSDRQTAGLLMPPDDLERANQHAQEMIAEGKPNDVMPTSFIPFIFTSPITAYRWNSLAAKGGDDDSFSADLDDATVSAKFGRIDSPILMLPGKEDELVPPSVDKKELLSRWIQACPKGTVSKLSVLVPEADHVISHPEAQEWVSNSVLRFLEALLEQFSLEQGERQSS